MFWHLLLVGRRRQKNLPFIDVQLIGEHIRGLLVKVFQKLTWRWMGISVAIWCRASRRYQSWRSFWEFGCSWVGAFATFHQGYTLTINVST